MSIVNEGSLIQVTEGAWSDFGVLGLFRALRDFSWDGELSAYLREHSDRTEEYMFEAHGFVQWLTSRGLLVEVEHDKWHLGDYSRVEEIWYRHHGQPIEDYQPEPEA